jgi:hypothetical protein
MASTTGERRMRPCWVRLAAVSEQGMQSDVLNKIQKARIMTPLDRNIGHPQKLLDKRASRLSWLLE